MAKLESDYVNYIENELDHGTILRTVCVCIFTTFFRGLRCLTNRFKIPRTGRKSKAAITKFHTRIN